MLNIKKIVLFVFMCVAGFAGKAQITSITPENGNNPFDYVGADHNEGLDYYIQHYPGATPEEVKANWRAFVTEFLIQKGYDTKILDAIMDMDGVKAEMGEDISFYETSTPGEELERLHEKGLLNTGKYSIVSQIHNLIKGIDASLYETGGDGDVVYANFKESMVSLENEMQELDEDDRNFCLIVASVARYSAFYWLNEGSKEVSEWGIPSYRTTGYRYKFSWGGLALTDVGGAVAGAVRFGVAALLGGPVGWAGAGIAALSTGLGASAGYAVISHFMK